MNSLMVNCEYDIYHVMIACHRNGEITTTPEELQEKFKLISKNLSSVSSAKDLAHEIYVRLEAHIPFEIHQYQVSVEYAGSSYTCSSWRW